MPTYQYACTECGERLEVVQSFTDAALTDCPACAGRLRKVFSGVGVVFKGSGFYRTDSRSGDAKGDKSDKPAEKKKDAAAPAASSAPATGSSGSTSTASSTSTSSSSSTSAA